MNTPDTEWQRKFLNAGTEKGLGDLSMMIGVVSEILYSRDTYWKERVENTRTALLFIGEKVLKEMSEIYAVDIKYADKKQWL